MRLKYIVQVPLCQNGVCNGLVAERAVAFNSPISGAGRVSLNEGVMDTVVLHIAAVTAVEEGLTVVRTRPVEETLLKIAQWRVVNDPV